MVERVCVLGNTMEQAVRLLDILCEANEHTVYRRRKNVGIMNDGTELIAKSVGDLSSFWGSRFDYVFYDRDQLLYSCTDYGSYIEYIQQQCLSSSIIPGEFQWCAVDVSIDCGRA